MIGKSIVVVSLLLLVVGPAQAADIHEAADSGAVEIIRTILAEDPGLVNAPDTEGNRPLHLAALNGHLDAVELLIANGADVNAGDGDNSVPLICAGMRGHLDVVTALVTHGATVEMQDNFNSTPLLVSCWSGNVDIIRLLVEKGASIDVRNNSGTTPLLAAAWRGNPVLVEYLLDKGVDVNAKNNRGTSVLHMAASREHTNLLQLFADRGVDLDIGDNEGTTPLVAAAHAGKMEAVRFLVEKGAAIDRGNNSGYTPLLASVGSGNLEVAEYLLDRGVDINARSNDGVSAVYQAAAQGHAQLLKPLVDRGADLTIADNAGMSPLAAAVHNAQVDAAKTLLELGADVNFPDNHGYTPLCHSMVWWVPIEMVHVLIEHGAEVNALTDSSTAPIVVASEQGANETARTLQKARVLLNSGAEVNCTNRHGDLTPLMIAAARGNDALAGLLVDEGAEIRVTDPLYNRTPLQWAAIRGKSELARVLLSHGADIEAHDKAGNSALYYATRYGNTSTADVLQTAGARKTEESYVPPARRMQRLGDNEAAIWYLGISGWAIKTRNHFLIFDYAEMLPTPDNPCLVNGHIDPEEIKDLDVVVLSSHEHGDHYDTTIFGWREHIPNITYILGHQPEDRSGYEYIEPRTDRTIGGLHVWTISSTDAGVGYLVEVDGLVIFHAGDHANGEVGLHAPYTDEIDYLANLGHEIDLAFLPITGCSLGSPESVKEGVYYALEKLTPRVYAPQHTFLTTYIFREFADEAEENGFSIPALCAENGGDCFLYKNGKIM